MSVTPAVRWTGILLLLALGIAAAALPNTFPPGSVVTRTLANGLRVVVREDHSLPIVSAVLVVRAGSGTDDARGAAHVAEHLVLQGTKRYPGRLAPQLALEQVGGVSDAITSRDMTRFQVTAPSDQVKLLVGVLADVALAPTLDDESFTRERPTVLAEIQQSADDVPGTLANLGYYFSFRTHPYRFRPSGTIEDILRLNAADVRDYVRRWYVPNNLSLVLVGDVTVKQAVALAEQHFGAAKAGTPPARPAVETPSRMPAETHIPLDLPSTYQVLVFAAPSADDFGGTAVTDVVSALLSSNGDGLLQEQWAQDGLAVQHFGLEYITTRGPGRLLIWAQTDPAQANRWLRSTQGLLDGLARAALSPDELALAKAQLAAQVLLDNETYGQQASTLAFYEGTGAAALALRYIPAVDAVTAAQVCAFMPTRLLARLTMGARPEKP